jgi:hypothetical protein
MWRVDSVPQRRRWPGFSLRRSVFDYRALYRRRRSPGLRPVDGRVGGHGRGGARGVDVDPEPAQSLHECLFGDVVPGAGAGEQPLGSVVHRLVAAAVGEVPVKVGAQIWPSGQCTQILGKCGGIGCILDRRRCAGDRGCVDQSSETIRTFAGR